LRATMSAIRHPCLIMGQCPSNFEGRNSKFDYEIELKPEGITILTGPNGYGKTTILRIIHAFGERNPFFFFRLRFSVIVFLQGGKEISLAKGSDGALTIRGGNEQPIGIGGSVLAGETEAFAPKLEWLSSRLQGMPAGAEKDSMEQKLRETIANLFKSPEGSEKFSSSELVGFLREWAKYPFAIYFIREQRLFKRKADGIPSELLDDFPDLGRKLKGTFEDSITEYARELSARHMKDALAAASKLSQELDGGFPERLFQESGSINEEEFNRRYEALRQRQNALSRYGLSTIREGHQASFSKENAKALLVYLNDTEKKLAVFDGILERLVQLRLNSDTPYATQLRP
ncbi:MAG: hypothetical protein BECKG1743F_GA0114225_109173, partial [Candidatus Kentron sp. G]